MGRFWGTNVVWAFRAPERHSLSPTPQGGGGEAGSPGSPPFKKFWTQKARMRKPAGGKGIHDYVGSKVVVERRYPILQLLQLGNGPAGRSFGAISTIAVRLINWKTWIGMKLNRLRSGIPPLSEKPGECVKTGVLDKGNKKLEKRLALYWEDDI